MGAAAKRGTLPEAAHRYTRPSEAKYRRIRALLAEGRTHVEIASLVGCGRSTVSREHKRMKEAHPHRLYEP